MLQESRVDSAARRLRCKTGTCSDRRYQEEFNRVSDSTLVGQRKLWEPLWRMPCGLPPLHQKCIRTERIKNDDAHSQYPPRYSLFQIFPESSTPSIPARELTMPKGKYRSVPSFRLPHTTSGPSPKTVTISQSKQSLWARTNFAAMQDREKCRRKRRNEQADPGCKSPRQVTRRLCCL
jgi:hypothetical protein